MPDRIFSPYQMQNIKHFFTVEMMEYLGSGSSMYPIEANLLIQYVYHVSYWTGNHIS